MGCSSSKADGAKAPIATQDDGCSSSAKEPIDGSSPEDAPEMPAATTNYDAADSEGLLSDGGLGKASSGEDHQE